MIEPLPQIRSIMASICIAASYYNFLVTVNVKEEQDRSGRTREKVHA